MGNNIINVPIHKIREIARNALRGNWKKVVIAVLIYYFLSSGVVSLLDYFFAYSLPTELYDGTMAEEKIGFGGSIYSLILGGPLQFGLAMFMLTFFRARKCDNTLLFEGFSNFSRTFVLAVLIAVKTMLWTFVFVIPGIIAAYKYSQAYYIMVDNPTMTPGQCIKESCRIMNGNKATLFILELSFIGWGLLASVPEAIYMLIRGIDALGDTSSIGAVLTTLVLGLPGLFVTAYTSVAGTAFYELATGRLVVVDEAPQQPENQNNETL